MKTNVLHEKENFLGLTGKVRWISYKKGTKEIVRQSPWKKNLIMFGTYTGKDGILKRLGGDNTYSLNILYGEIGKGVATPTVADTAMASPVLRVGSPVISQVSGTLSFQFFFPDADLTNDTYTSFSTWVDGSLTLSSGIIFNNVLFALPYVKGSNEDTIVQVDFTQT